MSDARPAKIRPAPLHHSLKSLTFAAFCSASVRPGRRMKRESGENPGQSRCCEFLPKGVSRTPACHCPAASGGWEGDIPWERVRRPAKQSRKTIRSRKAAGNTFFYIIS